MDQRLLVGTNLGPYTIVRLIGKGGMGEVYEAYEALLHRSVALKIITDEAIKGIPQVLNLFVKEGMALAQLNHPNVVTIYQLGNDKGIHYIAMEYVEGMHLEEYMAKHQPDFSRCIYIFYKVLLGVQALHRKGIVHRDLKPKNIIIQNEKKVKIVDFGIAEMMRETESQPQQQTREVMGSVHFMSPEIATGKAPTFQSDIWSLGVILHILLTKQRPFLGKNHAEILKNVKEQDITFSTLNNLTIPQKYQDMIQKLCNKSLADRYQSVDEILKDLNYTTSTASTAASSAAFWSWQSVAMAFTFFSAMTIGLIATKMALQKNKSPIPIESIQTAPIAITQPTQIDATEHVQETKLNTNTEVNPKIVEIKPTEPQVRHIQAKPQKPLAKTRLQSYQKQILISTKGPTNSRDLASAHSSIPNLPTLTWQHTPGAESYEFQLAADTHFKNLVAVRNMRETFYKWENPMPGTYYWRVRAVSKNRTDGEFSSTATLRVLLPKPITHKSNYKFTIKSSDAAGAKFTIDWAAVPFANSYQVLISKNRSMSGSPVIHDTVNGPQYTFNITNPGTYYFRVTALDLKREPASEPSKIASIQIHRAVQLIRPKLLQPMSDIVVPSQGTMITPIACSWSNSKSASTYEFELASDSEFKQIDHQTVIKTNQYVLTIPLHRGKFFWRVRAVSKDQNTSPWSEPRRFLID